MTKNSQFTTSSVNRQDGFERTFVVDVDPDAVWQAVARAAPATEAGVRQYHIPGLEAVCSEIECKPGEFLRMKKEEEPCKGTEVIIALEHAGSGTKITVVQAGFGPWLPDVIELFGYVWNMIIADMKLYIETGLQIKTHLFEPDDQPTVSLGCNTSENLTGLLVVDTTKNGFCEQAGVEKGDVLLQLNGVRLLNGMLLTNLLKMVAPGATLELVWAHDRQLKTRSLSV